MGACLLVLIYVNSEYSLNSISSFCACWQLLRNICGCEHFWRYSFWCRRGEHDWATCMTTYAMGQWHLQRTPHYPHPMLSPLMRGDSRRDFVILTVVRSLILARLPLNRTTATLRGPTSWHNIGQINTRNHAWIPYLPKYHLAYHHFAYQ